MAKKKYYKIEERLLRELIAFKVQKNVRRNKDCLIRPAFIRRQSEEDVNTLKNKITKNEKKKQEADQELH